MLKTCTILGYEYTIRSADQCFLFNGRPSSIAFSNKHYDPRAREMLAKNIDMLIRLTSSLKELNYKLIPLRHADRWRVINNSTKQSRVLDTLKDVSNFYEILNPKND